MKYRITKDCGAGWDEGLKTATSAWGLSETQHPLAKRVAPGDIFLHYIDHAHSWAGYSTVSGALRANQRDANPDWRAALPFVIPMTPVVWLTQGQCERTVVVPGLPEKRYERQVTFTTIPATEAGLIIEAIKFAKTEQSTASAAFLERWNAGAKNYYKGITKRLADGNCWLCREDATSCAARWGIPVSEKDLQSFRYAFLDAAHIVPDCVLGPTTPDNLRPLCPNCHRLVDRLPDECRKELLTRKQSV